MNTIIGKNLKRLRNANLLKQEQVASYLGENRSTYSNYESGYREPPLHVLEKASDLFGCEMSLLFEEDDKAVDEMLVCAFRIDNLSEQDLVEVARFKKIVKQYQKMNQLLER